MSPAQISLALLAWLSERRLQQLVVLQQPCYRVGHAAHQLSGSFALLPLLLLRIVQCTRSLFWREVHTVVQIA